MKLLWGMAFCGMASALAAVNSATGADWPMYAGNAQRAATSADVVPTSPERAWATRLRAKVLASPVVSRQTVYLVAHDQQVWALDTARGQVRWTYALSEVISSAPVVVDDHIVAVGKDGRVTALATADGSLRWQTRTAGKTVAALTADAGAVYLGSGNHLYAIDAADGSVRWRYLAVDSKFGGLFAAPALDGERVYVGGKNGTLHAVRRADGKRAWFAHLGSAMYGSPLVTAEAIYVGCYNRRIYAFEPTSGALLWTTQLDDWPQGTPLKVGAFVIAVSRTGVIYRLHAATGDIDGEIALGEEVRHSPALGADGLGVLATRGGRLLAFEPASGRIAWTKPLEQTVVAPPVLADGAVVVATQAGEVSLWR